MATSASTDFTVTAQDVIYKALRLVRATLPGQAPNQEMVQDGMDFLNLLVKSWQTDGLFLWAVSDATLPLVVGKKSYTISQAATSDLSVAQPKRIKQIIRTTTGGSRVPVNILSKDEFNRLPDSANGSVTNVYYDNQLNEGVLHVWPPSSNITDTLEVTYQRPFEDIDSPSNYMDFPKEWYLAVVYNLASILGDAYPTEDPISLSRVNKKARLLRSEALTWSVEDVSFSVEPEFNGYR